ncbi:MAG: hypothetical protein BGO98_44880 [Myxococcales bacterium 68-20]|nr:MAG: hypothetical protein BGO98_44880 [Myxococcales bacterium 68-20]
MTPTGYAGRNQETELVVPGGIILHVVVEQPSIGPLVRAVWCTCRRLIRHHHVSSGCKVQCTLKTSLIEPLLVMLPLPCASRR